MAQTFVQLVTFSKAGGLLVIITLIHLPHIPLTLTLMEQMAEKEKEDFTFLVCTLLLLLSSLPPDRVIIMLTGLLK